MPDEPDATHDPHHGSRITIHGALALFAARLLTLPPGEHLIVLDTTYPKRPRWRISQAGGWEKPRRESDTP